MGSANSQTKKFTVKEDVSVPRADGDAGSNNRTPAGLVIKSSASFTPQPQQHLTAPALQENISSPSKPAKSLQDDKYQASSAVSPSHLSPIRMSMCSDDAGFGEASGYAICNSLFPPVGNIKNASCGSDRCLHEDAYSKLMASFTARPSSFEEPRGSQVMGLVGPSRLSTTAMHKGVSNLELVSEFSNLPSHLQPFYKRLGILPADASAPLPMLMKLWSKESLKKTEEIVEELSSLKLVRVAILDDGSAWCLLATEHLSRLQALYADALPQVHRQLISSYTGNGHIKLKNIVDDGYILQNLSYHLLCGDCAADLRELLIDPTWIEGKLHTCGIAATVQDFRRYLGMHEADADIKLILHAFMLSLGCCMEHPSASMLRHQMLSRLMAKVAAQPPADTRMSEDTQLKRWYEEQAGMVAVDGVLSAGQHLVHLMPRSATLEQAGGLHRMTLRGHTGSVRKVVISPNGRDVVTVSEDGIAQVWDMNVGDCVMQLARDKPLTDVSISPDGLVCVVASEDGHCCVWDLESGKIRHVLKGHESKVNAVAIDRQGIRCVTVSDDKTARIWSLADGLCEQVLEGHGDGDGTLGLIFGVAISSDGTLTATVSDDFTCRVWDIDDDGECLNVLRGHTAWVTSVQFIGSTTDLITASHDHTARVWDASRGSCLHVLSGHTGRLNKVSVDAVGVYAVTCSDDYTARVWDLETGTCSRVLEGHSAWISDAAISRDGSHVVTVSGDETGIIWDAKSGNIISQLEGHSGIIRSVAMTSLGRFAVTASDDETVRVWDIRSRSLQKLDKHVGKVKMVKALQNERYVLSVGEDGQAIVWDVATGDLVHTLNDQTHAPLCFIHTCQDAMVATTVSADRSVSVWNAEQGTLISNVPSQLGSRVKDVAFDKAGKTAVVLLYEGSVSVLELASGALIKQLVKRGDRVMIAISGVLMSSCGRTVVTSSKTGSAHIWDIASGVVRGIIAKHGDGIVCMALNSNETLVATASFDHSVHLSALHDAECLATLQLPSAPILISFSPALGGLMLAVALDSNAVAVWDMSGTDQGPFMIPPHKGELTGMQFTPNGGMLATWGHGCTLRLWLTTSHHASNHVYTRKQRQVQFEEPVAFFMADAAINSCCFVGGGTKESNKEADIIAVGDASGHVHFLDFPREMQCL
ncbi:hypothetical protein CEUSTIGMA_g6995.t1 [Chlamydomonas eustigma]|uniref:APAF-1 helical domain-containing protein n=1 Tax=Chlamydomonas eustigma TaxID=1157962 RepID=A0A250X903_9CHLO|nr:hypothetical protein CEUSTIGMA_g6995.t1 [Chlamydomonas eustigma]|eukprot:GAX79554.1 hypothetical protein CEUSTIGMA_g6995.t1 [Chlamydomonas eustigma]